MMWIAAGATFAAVFAAVTAVLWPRSMQESGRIRIG